MDFATAAKNKSNWTYTENGAVALNTTSDACLDLFSTIGSLRDTTDNRIETLFAEAYKENPLFTTKIVFYGRDIRGGLGERQTFRTIIKYMAKYHPEALLDNMDLIGVFGRYDDLYSLIDTPLEDEMWKAMKTQFEEDKRNLEQGNAISLLAKWIKTADASSKKTRELGILTAQKLGYSVYDFKRIVRAMRKQIGVVEGLMSTKQWDKIKYSSVPSRAMMIYRNAFMKHDEERYSAFINKALTGEEKINSKDLFPYDIVQKIFKGEKSDVLEAQWRQLPDYVEKGTNAIVIADTSGSMAISNYRPLATSVGLAIYFAEHNTGAYKDLFMTFSQKPVMVTIKGENLYQKISKAAGANWGMNTNLEAAFDLILEIAVQNNIPQEEIPKSIIVISDMEIDRCANSDWTFYDYMKSEFARYGYEIPNIIFWNVESRHDIFHADKERKGVQLCSGQSITTFKQLMGCVGMTPMEFMNSVINSERYDCISVRGVQNELCEQYG